MDESSLAVGLADFLRIYRVHSDVIAPATRRLMGHYKLAAVEGHAFKVGRLPDESALDDFGAACVRNGVTPTECRTFLRGLVDETVPFLVRTFNDEPARLATSVVAMQRRVDTLIDTHFRESEERHKPGEEARTNSESLFDRLAEAGAEDVVERLKEQTALDAQYRGILEAAPDALIIVNSDGKIVLSNAQTARLFGYARDELLGQSIDLLVPARLRGKHPGHRASYHAAPNVRPMGADLDLYATRKDGSEFPAEISLSPLETPEGVFITAAVRDVTEQKQRRAEEQRRMSQELEADNRRMQEANRLKSEFLANMSHELRTPLNAIIGFAELMFNGKVGPLSDDHREYMGHILNSSNHLLRLINDVLELAKVESGKMEFRVETIDLAKVVGEVRDILRGLASTKRIQIRASIDPDVAVVTLDPSKLKQVLYNYLSNALKFTGDGGEISIAATPADDDRVRIEVKDTGVGVRPEDLPRLFVEFQQLDAGSSKKYAGTGFGLSLTRRIVEAQSGAVGVESEVGRGSVFWAELPRSMANEPIAELSHGGRGAP